VLPAEPDDVERFRVIGMVRLGLRVRAEDARLFRNLPAPVGAFKLAAAMMLFGMSRDGFELSLVVGFVGEFEASRPGGGITGVAAILPAPGADVIGTFPEFSATLLAIGRYLRPMPSANTSGIRDCVNRKDATVTVGGPVAPDGRMSLKCHYRRVKWGGNG
jgi:hypothetical protein